MAGTLRDLMEADISAVFLNTDEHAETVAYIPQDGESVTIDVVAEENAGIRSQGEGHKTLVRHLQTFCKKDASAGITQIRPGDVLIWDGLRWSSPEVLSGDEFSWVIRWSLPTIETSGRLRGGRL